LTVLVDTNVLLDLVQDDPKWADWSKQQLDVLSISQPLVINDVIYAELSIAYRSIEELEAALERTALQVDPIPREALFLAGKTFLRYRRGGGPRGSVLPDFFIGAHAAVSGAVLLTRDARRYRHYFPSVRVICP
jgi:predicted nucleic acid-binding protein